MGRFNFENLRVYQFAENLADEIGNWRHVGTRSLEMHWKTNVRAADMSARI
jgi:hypothetical protein